MSDAIDQRWMEAVLAYWFGELKPAAWFAKDTAVDARIRRDFLAVYERVRSQPPAIAAPRDALAVVIVLDQFPRNMFRNSPSAFATDALALQIARLAIAAGLDRPLQPVQRSFLYMPFQHSEDLSVQSESVVLFTELGDPTALKFAREHQQIIARFGRFPHRNAVLGRISSAEETEFLKTHAGF